MSIQSFTIADPRTFDGDPFEVAERAVRQSQAVVKVALQSLDGARLMARNAQLERELLTTGECDAPAYENSAEARKFDTVRSDLENAEERLRVLAKAVAFNPKAPLGPA